MYSPQSIASFHHRSSAPASSSPNHVRRRSRYSSHGEPPVDSSLVEHPSTLQSPSPPFPLSTAPPPRRTSCASMGSRRRHASGPLGLHRPLGPLLKRKLHNKYQLRFVNKVCEAYYTREQIKADDGNLLNVALYDENNSKITSGPLSSASVEVVVLRGDFNANGQDYWTSEEFSSCVVCPQSGKGRSTLGGDRVLVLVDGEASVAYAFFQKTSSFARTGKFKMGVKMKITLEERIQEGISESFFVTSRRGKANEKSGIPKLEDEVPSFEKMVQNLALKAKTFFTNTYHMPSLVARHADSRDGVKDECLAYHGWTCQEV